MLVILDGWGWREDPADNAVLQADTPTFDRLWSSCPHAFLRTSGRDVGLPPGQMGNSEVGHLNIGAGRLVMQDLPRINDAIESGSIAKMPALVASDRAPAADRRHVPSDGPRVARRRAFASGARRGAGQDSGRRRACRRSCTPSPTVATRRRDRGPTISSAWRPTLPSAVTIGTVCGRYYAMDRDNRWERVSKAYTVICEGLGARYSNAKSVMADAYAHDITDEFVVPAVVGDYHGMKDGDGLLCFNFRADRVREILAALLDPAFAGFPRSRKVKFAAAVGMTQYSAELDVLLQAIFPTQTCRTCWARWWPRPAARSCAWRRRRSIRTSPIS